MLIVFRGDTQDTIIGECPIIYLSHRDVASLPPRSHCLTLRFFDVTNKISIYFDGELLDVLNTLSKMRIDKAKDYLQNHFDVLFSRYGFPFHTEWEMIDKFPTLMLRRNHVHTNCQASDHLLVAGQTPATR